MKLELEIAKANEHLDKICKLSPMRKERREEWLIEFLIERRDGIRTIRERMEEGIDEDYEEVEGNWQVVIQELEESLTREIFTRREILVNKLTFTEACLREILESQK